MSNVPALNGRDAIRILETFGFECARSNGSHVVMKKSGYPSLVTVPVHGARSLKRGTLLGIIRASGISQDEFFDRA